LLDLLEALPALAAAAAVRVQGRGDLSNLGHLRPYLLLVLGDRLQAPVDVAGQALQVLLRAPPFFLTVTELGEGVLW
jgi:hypothetical protein